MTFYVIRIAPVPPRSARPQHSLLMEVLPHRRHGVRVWTLLMGHPAPTLGDVYTRLRVLLTRGEPGGSAA